MKLTPSSRLSRRSVGSPVAIILGIGLLSGCGGASGDGSGDYSALEFRAVLMADLDTPAGEPMGADDGLSARFAALDCSGPRDEAAYADVGPEASVVACDWTGGERFALGRVEVDGSMVDSVSVSASEYHDGESTGNYGLDITLSAAGATAMEEMTSRLSGLEDPRNRMAMLVDGEVLSAPTVMATISAGEISLMGQFTEDQARDIAAALGADLE